jgi:hypothetical protein
VPHHPDPHAHQDAIAWQTILDRPQHEPVGPPRNFAELRVCEGVEFAEVLDGFLENFYSWRRASFFEHEPPTTFRPEYRAFLAALAEFLCTRYGLPVPPWTSKSAHVLNKEWDPILEMDEIPVTALMSIETLRERAAPEFRRRGILFAARNLIRV